MKKDMDAYSKDNNTESDEYGLDTGSYSDEGGYPMNVKVEKGFYTVYELKRKYDKHDKQIILDSAFQRHDVWKLNQKAELVESILMGLPLPIFYFNEDRMGRLIVVDGRQRLTALFEYLDNSYALKGLKILKELNGKKFNMLDPLMQSKVEDYQIQAHVIKPPTPDRIKFDIFDRVNRAGTQLNKQEIRNALYQGEATELLKTIADSEEFAIATGSAFVTNSRMKDRYIILRYIAFELYFQNKIQNENGKRYEYRNDIDELLGLTMEYINTLQREEIEAWNVNVKCDLRRSFYYLGENAFRLIHNGKRSAINMNVFEIIMHIMSQLEDGVEYDATYIRYKMDEMKENMEFLESIGPHRDNKNKIAVRYEIADRILMEI